MLGITLQQLEIFLTVVHCQSMSHAAKELFLSQPAVSNWISKLEDALEQNCLYALTRDNPDT